MKSEVVAEAARATLDGKPVTADVFQAKFLGAQSAS